ncbi:NADP-dependent oxidoreductase [Krasilnikovia sp. M28-CT-15]|uniref:NADP-dependent oxidoreductase n=1 Tax=Krasilnikovia sp. M28-CT-15 TaxID=3373540 RepID=UPI00399C515C
MRALHVPAAGQAPVLGELPTPQAGDGQVLVQVKAASLNGIDNAIVAGLIADLMPHEYPLVVGRDAAGIVAAVGAGVAHVEPGDAVIGHVLLAPPVQAGTIAEYAVLPAAAVTAKPPELDDVTAAAIPLAGTAALTAVDAIDPKPGQVVLVNGAGGGVGSYAVQLLAARGVTVVATGTAPDADRLIRLGAATVVDYTAGDVAARVRAAHPDGVDALIELAAFTVDSSPLAAVHRGGQVASATGIPDEKSLEAAGLTGTHIVSAPVREVIAALAEQVAAGTLTADVGTVLPLDAAVEGFGLLAGRRARGKIVITVGD